jgi:hypothetical protein
MATVVTVDELTDIGAADLRLALDHGDEPAPQNSGPVIPGLTADLLASSCRYCRRTFSPLRVPLITNAPDPARLPWAASVHLE